jgi:hypothetical protein
VSLVARHPDTYRDGVGSARCAACHQVVRPVNGLPVVSVRVADVEAVLGGVPTRVAWGETLTRLAQAVGQSVAQILTRQQGATAMRMVGYTHLLVSEAELARLATGVVPRRVRVRAGELRETLHARLVRNAARLKTTPAPPRPPVTTEAKP